MSVFLCVPGNGSDNVVCLDVSLCVRISNNSVPEPFHDYADGYLTVVRSSGGFRSVPNDARQGSCLDSFSLRFYATAK